MFLLILVNSKHFSKIQHFFVLKHLPIINVLPDISFNFFFVLDLSSLDLQNKATSEFIFKTVSFNFVKFNNMETDE